MLCNLAVRQTREDDAVVYLLRFTGKAALGPSGTGGRDAKEYPTPDALLTDLQELGVGPDVLAETVRALEHPKAAARFIDIAEDVQIPFETLQRADIHLFS